MTYQDYTTEYQALIERVGIDQFAQDIRASWAHLSNKEKQRIAPAIVGMFLDENVSDDINDVWHWAPKVLWANTPVRDNVLAYYRIDNVA